jgi:hypothetical protein
MDNYVLHLTIFRQQPTAKLWGPAQSYRCIWLGHRVHKARESQTKHRPSLERKIFNTDKLYTTLSVRVLSVYTLKHSFTPHFLFITSRFTCSAKIETIGLTYNVGMPSSGKSRVMSSTAWRSVWHLTPSINNLQQQSIYIHDFRSHGDGSPWLRNLVESSRKAKQHHKCHGHQPIRMSTLLFLQFYNHGTGVQVNQSIYPGSRSIQWEKRKRIKEITISGVNFLLEIHHGATSIAIFLFHFF